MLPASSDALKLLKDYDKEIKYLSEAVYEKIKVLDGLLPKSIVILRKTNYMLYWFASTTRKFI